MLYYDIYELVAIAAANQTKVVNFFKKDIHWKVNFYIDISYSGGAIEQVKQWIKDNGGKVYQH